MAAASSSSHIIDVRKPRSSPRPEIYLDNIARAIQSEARLEQSNFQDKESEAEYVEIPPIIARRGSKRVAARQTTSAGRPAKRARLTQQTSGTERDVQTFLALEHVFEITLSKGDTYNDDQARDYGINGDAHVIDGPFPHGNKLFIAPKLLQDSFDLSDYDLPLWCSDILAAAIELEQNDRVRLETHLRIQPAGTTSTCNPTTSTEPEFPFTFHLHLKLFLKSPSIFQPIDFASTIEAAQHRLLLHVFRDHIEPPADFHVNLSHFYGCFKSAPLIPIRLQKQIQPEGLKSDLLPFQRRSVLWMLQREGKTISPEDGKIIPLPDEQKHPPLFWVSLPPLGASTEGQEMEKDNWWFNVVTGELLPTRPPDDKVMGGLLAEEPGLGKTVESIALILYNTPHPSNLPPSSWSEVAEVEVTPIKGTLVVTPATLCKQWADELTTHAPHLRVLQYEGWTSPDVKKVLSRSGSPLKPQTTTKPNTKRKSSKASVTSDPGEIDLDSADWRTFAGHFDVILTTYNVLMKELNVARVPIKRSRREAAAYQPSDEKFRSPLIMVEWQRVLMDEVQQVGGGKAAEMVSLIPRRSSWAVSGTPAKAQVEDLIAPIRLMRIHPVLSDAPPATRSKLWDRILKPGFWASFRNLFDRYAVRTSKREAEGLDIPKQTRFVVPVSLGMVERHVYDHTFKTSLLELGLDARGVSLCSDSELNAPLLRSVIRKLRMACIHPQVGALGVQAARNRGAQGGGSVLPISDVLTKMVDTNWQTWMTDRKTLVMTRIDRALLSLKKRSDSSRNNTLKELIHLRQDTLSLIEELSKANEESASYGNAEGLRKLLLKTTEDLANRAIARLTREVIQTGVSSKQLVISRSAKPGIKRDDLFSEANHIIHVLDSQRNLIFKWRGIVCKLLTQEIASERSASGNEYQKALNVQREVEEYLAAYAALLADRREVLNQERTALAAYNDREDRSRRTKTSARAAAAADQSANLADGAIADNGRDLELARLLKRERQDCKKKLPGNRALRSVMVELGKVSGTDPEQQIAKDEAQRLRRILHDQCVLIDQMLKEMAPMRVAFNGRIAYFRQLQELSDSVAEIVLGDQTLRKALEDNDAHIQRLEDSVRTKSARQRYLQYIARKSEDLSGQDEECGICSCDFEMGYLLVCGHLYCDTCIRVWRKHCEVAIPCPDCRAESQAGEINSITFGSSTKEQVDQLQQRSRAGLKANKYNTIPTETLEALAKIESFGQYGAKIQTLVRHLLLLEETDRGTKSILFSAWAESLKIIEHALTTNGISCIRIDANTGKRRAAHQFQTDPAIRVLLLHGERENSGLNLTCAKRIMLVEPTVNISFEIQAIARVDRLGQTEETEVYCYYALDTVEQNILNIAARKGASLYTTSNATTAVDLAAPAVIERQDFEASTKDRKLLRGDGISGTGLMLEVLFPDRFVDNVDTGMANDIEGTRPLVAQMQDSQDCSQLVMVE